MAWGWDQREPAERLVGARVRGPGAGAWWLACLGSCGLLETTLVDVPEKAHGKIVKSVVVGCCRFIFRLQCRKAGVVLRGELTNHPDQRTSVRVATTTWRRSHHEEIQPTEQVSVNDAIILSSTRP